LRDWPTASLYAALYALHVVTPYLTIACLHTWPASPQVLLTSHLGRPKKGPEDKFRLNPVQPRLTELLGQTVEKADDCVGAAVTDKLATMKNGSVSWITAWALVWLGLGLGPAECVLAVAVCSPVFWRNLPSI
jgi:hypothetical protein